MPVIPLIPHIIAPVDSKAITEGKKSDAHPPPPLVNNDDAEKSSSETPLASRPPAHPSVETERAPTSPVLFSTVESSSTQSALKSSQPFGLALSPTKTAPNGLGGYGYGGFGFDANENVPRKVASRQTSQNVTPAKLNWSRARCIPRMVNVLVEKRDEFIRRDEKVNREVLDAKDGNWFGESWLRPSIRVMKVRLTRICFYMTTPTTQSAESAILINGMDMLWKS